MFLFSKISTWDIVNDFDNNQIHKMIEYCIEKNLLNNDEKVYAGKVAIMTPENIHINAFIYEPIIDMSDDELITLYSNIKLLK